MKVCPECDRNVRVLVGGTNTESRNEDYSCRYCSWSGDDVNERERDDVTGSSAGQSGPAKILRDADPEEWP